MVRQPGYVVVRRAKVVQGAVLRGKPVMVLLCWESLVLVLRGMAVKVS